MGVAVHGTIVKDSLEASISSLRKEEKFNNNDNNNLQVMMKLGECFNLRIKSHKYFLGNWVWGELIRNKKAENYLDQQWAEQWANLQNVKNLSIYVLCSTGV